MLLESLTVKLKKMAQRGVVFKSEKMPLTDTSCPFSPEGETVDQITAFAVCGSS